MASRKEPPTTGTSSVSAIIPSFYSTSSGDCEGATLRSGNVSSADGWQELLEPVVKGYQKKGLRLLFRGDAAFAKPRAIRVSGRRKDGLRHPASRQIRWFRSRSSPCLSLLPNGPSREPMVSYHDFAYQAQSWRLPRRVVAKVEWHRGELFPRGRFHRDQPELSTQRDSPLLQWPGHGGAVDQGGQIRLELGPGFPATSSWPTR